MGLEGVVCEVVVIVCGVVFVTLFVKSKGEQVQAHSNKEDINRTIAKKHFTIDTSILILSESLSHQIVAVNSKVA